MISIDKNKVEKFVDTHCKEVHPKLITLIENKIKEVANDQQEEYCVKLLEYIKNTLEEILKASPNKLKNIINQFIKKEKEIYGLKSNITKKELQLIAKNNKIPDYLNKKKDELYSLVYNFFNKKIKKVLKEIFENEYDNWGKRKKYGAYKFVESLNIKTCPYCNRNYISTVVKEEGQKKTRPQIDHFYPKSIYPYLAMSFYNLIPSCSTCNSMKSDDDSYKDKLKSPYQISKDDFKFTYNIKNKNFLSITSNPSNTIKDEKSIDVIFKEKIKANTECFALDKLYKNEHSDIVIELLLKKLHYPKSYVENLTKFGFSSKEVYRFLVGNYIEEKDLHKRPLSKLLKDIAEELKMIKLDKEGKYIINESGI